MSFSNTSISKKIGKVFFGWWTVVASFLVHFWGIGVWFYGFNVYFNPLMNEFGWTRAQTAAAPSLGAIEGGIEGPLAGWLTEKFGMRMVNFLGVLIAGLGLCLMYFIDSLVGFYIVWGFIVSTGFNLTLLEGLETAISNWFVKKRGTALGINRIGIGLGGTIVPWLMTILIIQFHWRIAFVIAGITTWAIGLPLAWFLIKPHRPEQYGLLPDGVNLVADAKQNMMEAGQEYAFTFGEVEFSLPQALKTRAFWMLTFWSVTIGIVMRTIASVHLVPFLTDAGMDSLVAAEILGLMIFISIPTRLLGGILGDRLKAQRLKYLIIFICSMYIFAVFTLHLINSSTMGLVYVFIAAFGIGMGIEATATHLIRGRYFGRRSYATIAGVMQLIRLPAVIIVPIYTGWVHDVTGSYSNAFTTILLILLITLLVTFFADPPKAEVTTN